MQELSDTNKDYLKFVKRIISTVAAASAYRKHDCLGFVFTIAFLCCFAIFLSASAVSAYPSNAMVRVCIMDSSYTTIEKKNLSIYGTEECIITDTANEKEILRLPKGEFLNITRKGAHFLLKYETRYETHEEEIEEGNSDSNGNEIESVCEVKSDLRISCPAGVLGIKDLTRGGKPALYRGVFEIKKSNTKEDVFYLINFLDVEYYLKGVVPSEMPAYFGLEALKAQAVAARNYSLSVKAKPSNLYDVVDSVASQVYHGYNRESDITNTAVDETHGLVALYNDDMILAVFSSTAGGYTENYSNTFSDPLTKAFPAPDKPYLKAIPDLPETKPLNNEDDAFKFYSTSPPSYDIHSPLYRWRRIWTKSELENILKSTLLVQSKTGFVKPELLKSDDFDSLKSIKVTKRGASGKVISMEIETDKKKFTVNKELVIRRLFIKDGKALPSANVVFKYEISDDGNWSDITAYGGGFGHGSGMSQFGAMYMALDCNMSFETILKHYYKGICIGTKPFELSDKSITQCFYAPESHALLVIPNKKDLKILELNINGTSVRFDFIDKSHPQEEIDLSEYIKKGTLNTVIFTPLKRIDRCRFSRHKSVNAVKMYIKLL